MIDSVDEAVVDAINTAQAATMDYQVIRTGGAGKAYQAVAASAALAIQDAVASLRQATAVATTASAMALTQFLASGDPRYLEALSHAQAMTTRAIQDFADISKAAAETVTNFPSG